MSAAWRQVGLNYINYSQICARVVRQCLKPEFRTTAELRDKSIIKFTKWTDGKPGKSYIDGEEVGKF